MHLFSTTLVTILPILAAAQDTVTVVPTTITQTFYAAASTTPLSPSYTTPIDFRTSILNSTNTYRYEHSAGYIYWNTTLADYAQKYSENCVWEHSHGPYGENLARGYPDVTSAVDAWGNERAMYHFSSKNPTGFSEATGHFSQLVWKSTQATGCGWTNCDGKNGLGGIFLVCEYWPAGNVVGDDNQFFIQNVVNERSAGIDGFSEESATAGVTGGTPTPTSSGPSGPTQTVQALAVPVVEVGHGRVVVTILVGVAAVLFGVGMS